MQNAIPGFICAYRFDAAGLATPLAETDAAAIKDRRACWIWLHLNFADRRCEHWLVNFLGLTEAQAGAVCERAIRQQIASQDKRLLGHINDFRREFDTDSTEHAWTHFVLGGDFIVTGRVKAVQSADLLRKELARGQHFTSPGSLFTRMLANYPDTLDAALHRLMDELEIIEDHILDDHHRGERKRLMLVRREAAQLHRHTRAQRRALVHAERTLPGLPEGLAQVISRLGNLDQDFEGYERRARFFHDEIDAKLAAETNRQLYTLSALTAAFLPPALVAGLFGMNFPVLPWGGSSYGFWIALGLCLLSSAMVWLYLWYRNRR